jgi:hypothetical protein
VIDRQLDADQRQARHEHRTDVEEAHEGLLRALHGEHLGREREEDDRRQPRQVPPHQPRGVAAHLLEDGVVGDPVARDHDEAEPEREQPVTVLPHEVERAGVAPDAVVGCVDQRQDEQRDGDGDDRVAEVDEAVEAPFRPRVALDRHRHMMVERPGRRMVLGRRGGRPVPSDP